MGWKEELSRTESSRTKAQPGPTRPYTAYTVCSMGSEHWGRPLSAISSFDSESAYSQPCNTPPVPPSVYSMATSSRPGPQAYANIIPSYPPDSPKSVRYDNGTGKLDPEILAHIKRTGKVPRNVERTNSIDVALASAKMARPPMSEVSQARARQAHISRAPSHHSMAPSLACTTASITTSKEKRHGIQDLPSAPAPLTYSTRKKTAGSGIAGSRPPVPPLPPSKAPSVSQRPQDVPREFLATPYSPPAALPHGEAHHSYPSKMLAHLDTEPRAHRDVHTRRDVLPTQTATSATKGVHLSSVVSRPSRPAKGMPSKGKGKARDDDDAMPEETPAVHSASVAAGRAMWNAMRADRLRARAVAGYRSTWMPNKVYEQPMGRKSEYEGKFLHTQSLQQVSVKKINSRKSVNKRRTEEEKIKEKEKAKVAKGKAKTGQGNGDVSKLSTAQVISDAKKSGGWFSRQSWRYGDVYWEKVPKDKKGKGKAQQ